MAPGAGKTLAMLQAAQKERLAGRDVLLACLEDAGLASKSHLLKGLHAPEDLPQTGVTALDIHAIIAQRPDLVVVDSLAHNNGEGARHRDRYLEVLELVAAGIDVFTTLNVGQTAGWNADVTAITGVTETAVVPDSVVDQAELELVDLPPREFIRRISRGETRFAASEAAKAGLLDEDKLLLLRHLTFRFFSERAARDAKESLRRRAGPGIAPGQRFLVVARPEYDSEPVIRWTRKLVDGLNATWLVLYVETARALTEPQQLRVAANLALARELGAEIITTTDEDTLRATLRVARQRNVHQVILGKLPAGRRLLPGSDDALVSGLLNAAHGFGVSLIPVQLKPGEARPRTRHSPVSQYAIASTTILLVTAFGFLITPWIGPHATALIFLLTVVLLALFLRRGPTLVAAALSALCWDYFILPPVFAFQVAHFEDAMLLGMYFIVALAVGNLTTRLRAQEQAERERENRATALFLLTRDLNEAVGLEQMAQRIVQQLESCFKARVALLLPQEGLPLKPHPGSTLEIPATEKHLPQWVLEHNQRAGAYTPNSPFASALYLPLSTSSGTLGVLALKSLQPLALGLHQENLLDAVSQQIAIALDRHRLNDISEKAKLLAESERLSKTLLDSVSHELRTPIAAIKSATGNLAELSEADADLRRNMLEEIQEATERLNRVVGNVLEASRLESGALKPRLTECDVGELLHIVLQQTEKQLSGHKLELKLPPGLPLVSLDFVLTQEAVANLLSNAALHTPPGTPLALEVEVEDDALFIIVADRGPGIPPESLPRIFDKFYRVPNSRTGGTGLGLSLVKGFIEAQGGQVSVKNRQGGGVAFTITLPRRTGGSGPSQAEPAT